VLLVPDPPPLRAIPLAPPASPFRCFRESVPTPPPLQGSPPASLQIKRTPFATFSRCFIQCSLTQMDVYSFEKGCPPVPAEANLLVPPLAAPINKAHLQMRARIRWFSARVQHLPEGARPLIPLVRAWSPWVVWGVFIFLGWFRPLVRATPFADFFAASLHDSGSATIRFSFS